jgi:hypothetical protein
MLRGVWNSVNAGRFGGTGMAVDAARPAKSSPLISTKPITDEITIAAVSRSCDLYEPNGWLPRAPSTNCIRHHPQSGYPCLKLTSSVAAGSIR